MNDKTNNGSGQPNGADNTSQASGFGGIDPNASSNDGGSAPGGTDPSNTGQGEPSGGSSEFTMPEGLQGEDGALIAEKVTEHLQAQHTAAAERIEKFGEVPEGDYEMPGPIEIEGGDSVELDPENTFLKGFLSEAKEMGLGQKAVTSMLEQYAKSAVADAQTLSAEAGKAVLDAQNKQILSEFESLGDQRDARMTSMGKAVSELVSDEASSALLNDIRTKASFEALEALILKAQGGTENPNPGTTGDGDEDNASILFS